MQGKKINRVACGSAHTLAWSTNKPVATSKLPTAVPLEYDILQDMSPTLLRNRLVLLHHFSDIFCPGIAMFPLGFSVRLIFNFYDCLNLSEKIFRKLRCDIDYISESWKFASTFGTRQFWIDLISIPYILKWK